MHINYSQLHQSNSEIIINNTTVFEKIFENINNKTENLTRKVSTSTYVSEKLKELASQCLESFKTLSKIVLTSTLYSSHITLIIQEWQFQYVLETGKGVKYS